MRKIKRVIASDADALARVLGLRSDDAAEMTVRRRLNDKIIQAVKASEVTHAQLAKAAQTSRSRVTAILNRNTAHVSTDLMLRLLAALGYRARITFVRSRHAA